MSTKERQQGSKSQGEANPFRPQTREILGYCYFCVRPSKATLIEFNIDTDRQLNALQFAIREELVTPLELDAAMGSGIKLTEIIQRGENPFRDVTFHTSSDDLSVEPEAPPEIKEGSVSEEFGRMMHNVANPPGLAKPKSDYDRMLDESSRPNRETQKQKER